MAYVIFADGHVNPPPLPPIEGGPQWINADRYTIHAESEHPTSQTLMHGPMFQALLEERFRVRVHRETREVPAYALTAVKGGPKLKRFQEGSCVPLNVLQLLSQFPPPSIPDPPKGQKYCLDRATGQGGLVTVDAQAYTLDEFTRMYFLGLDRPVINQTGLVGKFDIHLEYAADPAPDVVSGPSIFTAVQEQLGLKLEPAKGPREFLVIDRVERPSEN